MQLVTLAEAKERLSIDFSDKDGEITGLINAIEGYLTNATGLDLKALKAEIDKAEPKPEIENPLPGEDDGLIIPLSDETEEVNEQLLATAYVAKEYVLLKAYLDYYGAHTEIDDLRLTNLIKQLQVSALGA